MDLNKLKDKATELLDRRGGTEGLKADAQKLKDIATGEGSLKEKADKAAQALKTPPETAAPEATAPPEPIRPPVE